MLSVASRPLPSPPAAVSRLLHRGYADLQLPPPALDTVAALPVDIAPLLDHTGGMTRALAQHWQAAITLTVRHRTRTATVLRRVITLATPARPVAFGLIEIDLAPLAPGVRDAVLAESAPFGAILAQAEIRFTSRPQCFFTLAADGLLARSLDIPLATRLYGRETQLDALLEAMPDTGQPTGRPSVAPPLVWTPLAQVLEIVPPV